MLVSPTPAPSGHSSVSSQLLRIARRKKDREKGERKNTGQTAHACVPATRNNNGKRLPSDFRTDVWEWLTCGFGCPVAEEPRLAALDNLETRVLRGLRQVLGLSSQECVEVLQLRDLENRQCYGQVQLEKPDGEGEAQGHTLLPTST